MACLVLLLFLLHLPLIITNCNVHIVYLQLQCQSQCSNQYLWHDAQPLVPSEKTNVNKVTSVVIAVNCCHSEL